MRGSVQEITIDYIGRGGVTKILKSDYVILEQPLTCSQKIRSLSQAVERLSVWKKTYLRGVTYPVDHNGVFQSSPWKIHLGSVKNHLFIFIFIDFLWWFFFLIFCLFWSLSLVLPNWVIFGFSLCLLLWKILRLSNQTTSQKYVSSS